MWWNKTHIQTVELHAPYPHDLPDNVLTWGRIYDIEEWRAWYAELGFDIEDIRTTVFLDNSRCTILTYRQTKANGRPFLRWTPLTFDAEFNDPITVEYSTPPPAYT